MSLLVEVMVPWVWSIPVFAVAHPRHCRGLVRRRCVWCEGRCVDVEAPRGYVAVIGSWIRVPMVPSAGEARVASTCWCPAGGVAGWGEECVGEWC